MRLCWYPCVSGGRGVYAATCATAVVATKPASATHTHRSVRGAATATTATATASETRERSSSWSSAGERSSRHFPVLSRDDFNFQNRSWRGTAGGRASERCVARYTRVQSSRVLNRSGGLNRERARDRPRRRRHGALASAHPSPRDRCELYSR